LLEIRTVTGQDMRYESCLGARPLALRILAESSTGPSDAAPQSCWPATHLFVVLELGQA